MDKKTLCLVLPSLQAGGMERVMSELVHYFCNREDFEVHLILYGRVPEVFYDIPKNLHLHKPQSAFNNDFRIFASIGRLFFLRKSIRKLKPDTVLSFGEYWNSFVLLALIGLSYPVYISDRCSPEKKFKTLHSFLRKTLYPYARGIIAQTGIAREIYLSQFKHNNIKVIGNPIHEINIGEGIVKQNIVLMVGRLIKSKNQDKLIELFLNCNNPDWKLIIIGYDHLQQRNFERLKSIIVENHAEHKVFLEGKQADVDSYYAKSKIFAFTSHSEGFPNAIGEAMSAGLPVIAFDCIAGPSEMVKDNYNGFLVPVFNYELFQEKLDFLMHNEKIRTLFGHNAMKDIKQFSISKIGEQYLQFILDRNLK
jgi:GalNAc-alpha-(1->4)-GalNAc-alpha-(1->3)-diNAcBac-PP-undecaprenol alpha-1,4-N-acetyl-D-galactosaminyltransferase